MCHIKEMLNEDFICALNTNFLVAMSAEDYQAKRFTSIEELPWLDEMVFTGFVGTPAV